MSHILQDSQRRCSNYFCPALIQIKPTPPELRNAAVGRAADGHVWAADRNEDFCYAVRPGFFAFVAEFSALIRHPAAFAIGHKPGARAVRLPQDP